MIGCSCSKCREVLIQAVTLWITFFFSTLVISIPLVCRVVFAHKANSLESLDSICKFSRGQEANV